jgi:hypothetical protein
MPRSFSLDLLRLAGAPRAGMVLALTLACAGVTAGPVAAQSAPPPPANERYDDPVGNGVAIGAALGAIGGVLVTGALYAQCNDSCDAPAEAPTYAMYAGLGAGIGAGTGWVIDKLHKGKRPAAIPVAVAIRADRLERAVRLQWRF